MIQRIVTAAVLSAGVAVFFSPSFAQTATGTTGGVSTGTGSSSSIGTTTPSPAPQGGGMTTTSPSGSMSSSGTMSGSQSGSMTTTQGGAGVSGSQSGTMGTNTMGTNTMGTNTMGTNANIGTQANAQYNVNQAQGPRRAGRVNDAAERQVTECLNNAAAQRQSFDSCRR